ncbi:helix-turn-helix domain-containing protein [Streptomyces cinereospinus]|uniref:Helix-turn-helix domain-containing protein n=1 Tax=Streptomyces cinereospinus TaxID=285561 RepID=A0ABV5N2K9_9ACTN
MSTATALTPDEVRALPAMLTAAQAFAALAIGETCAYGLIKAGEFPVEVIKFGRTYRFRKADVMAFLGLSESPAPGAQPAATTSDAPGVQPGAPIEQPAPTSK